MYEILRKGRLHNLSISCQYDLFHKIVTPISLYGCEIWCNDNTDLIERLNLKFVNYYYAGKNLLQILWFMRNYVLNAYLLDI